MALTAKLGPEQITREPSSFDACGSWIVTSSTSDTLKSVAGKTINSIGISPKGVCSLGLKLREIKPTRSRKCTED
jgi:hypothetical protein